MPGFNGTGPLGRGTMTGRGKGYCMVNLTRENSVQQLIVAGVDTPTQNSYPSGASSKKEFFPACGLGCRGGRRFVRGGQI